MFRKILIPHDGSAVAGAVFTVACTVARAMGAQILLIRVVPEELHFAPHYLTEQAQQSLERIQSEIAGPGLTLRTLVRHGDPVEQILDAARTEHVDLIAMATYGLTAIDRLVVGSVSEQIVAKSPVAVLLVRPDGRRVRRLRSILVPTDGSPGAALALSAALPLARSSGATLTLLQVTPHVPDWRYHVAEGGELGRDLRVGQDYEEAGRLRAEDNVKRMAERLRANEFRAMGLARVGEPAAVIVESARECQADLIVMSTRALTGPVRAILGSVADAVVHTADEPVLLVRRGDWPGRAAPPPMRDTVSASTVAP